MKNIILIILFTSLLFSCSSSDDSNSNNNNNSVDPACQSQDFITKFNNIPNNATYNDVKTVFGSDGDNYLNTANSNNYKWYPCSDHNYFVDFWFQNNTLMLHKNRTISDFSICSDNISITSFSSLTVGMTYNQVSSILNCPGDNFRTDNPTTANSRYVRFYNCNDTSKFIEAWFSGDNSTSFLISKNF